ncbi:MAG: aconitase X catalytic domain-containing protein [Methanomassiliicoccus sp.]|nr:aconitase X catalytic domain-containing protein [Methanomassiliicoccus sp.]
MFLTREEEAMLAGEKGEGTRTAMELLVALGDIYEAKRLVPIASAHLSGVSYKTIGEGGIGFLESLAKDAKVCVPTTLNPAGMDRQKWREMGISPRFADRQQHIIECYGRLGVNTDCSCTPYLNTNIPKRGQTLAWAESSALSYANSVIGARTNREGGPGALAAAIVGRTPEYGLHLGENRLPSVVVEVDLEEVDYSLLGHAAGSVVGSRVPYFRGIRPTTDQMKTMAAAMAAAGSVALFHIEGVTPEADPAWTKGLERITLGRQELEAARNKLDTGKDPELIALGCPHLSVEEVRTLAARLKGRKRKGDAEVWFCTSRCTAAKCSRELEVLSKFGQVVCDTCMIVTPIEERFKTTATNSGKACSYLPTLCSQKVVYRTTDGLLEMIS